VRVEKLQAEFDINVVYTMFPLHPDTPENGLTLEQLFAGRNIDLTAAQERIAGLVADEGLPYGKRTMTYNSRLAQELGKWAEQQSEGDNIHNALYQAYFVDGMNLAKIDRLVSIAEQVGLSPLEAERVLENREYRAKVDADWNRARSLGVNSVPTFVIENQGVAGALPYEQLEAFVLQSGASRREP